MKKNHKLRNADDKSSKKLELDDDADSAKDIVADNRTSGNVMPEGKDDVILDKIDNAGEDVFIRELTADTYHKFTQAPGQVLLPTISL